MDPLSDVLRVVRMSGAVSFTARLGAPWCFHSPPPAELAPTLGVRPECLSHFHILVEGSCWVEMEGAEPLELQGGSVLVLPHGDAHTLGSRLDLPPESVSVLLGCATGEGVPSAVYGSGERPARFVCGYFYCDQRFAPLTGALPRLLVALPGGGILAVDSAGRLSRAGGGDGSGREGWLERTVRYTVEEAESGRPGSPAMLGRLTELLYLELLRRFMRSLPEGETGWIAGIRDRDVGQALRLMHRHPSRAWTVDELAHAVHVSRSTLAERFTAIVGEPPMRYLAAWRVQLAKHLLRERDLSIAQVAEEVGYGSKVAFHRAFKRHVGQPPAEWREGRAAARVTNVMSHS